MPEVHKLLLRVLYTINSSSYILARSPIPVPVTFINDDSPEYGSVAFKTCLEAMCRSSPELMQDRSRDFSVYVLDPLETNAAPAAMDISNSSGGRSTDPGGGSAMEQSRGMAVGMGLMSWALSVEEKDPITVVGTLGKTGAGQDAIEVIIALRETVPMDQTRLPNSSRSWGTQHSNRVQISSSAKPSNTALSSETLATIASIQNRVKAKNKPKKLPRVSSTPVTESDKLLNADTYIGPVKKKGRPKGQSNGEAKVKAEESTSSTVTSQAAPASICFGSSTTTFQSISNMTSSSQKSDSTSGGLDLAALAALFSTTQSDATRNTSLLNTLSFIDSPGVQSGSQSPVNPALVNALRQLLSSAYSNVQPGAAPPAVAASSPTLAATQSNSAPSNDDEIVLLEKENVNPAAFKCRPQKDDENTKLAGGDARTKNPTTEPQTRGLGARSIENSPPKSVLNPVPPPTLSLSMRKRTLDDCMEERDNKRNKTHRVKGKEKDHSDKKDTSRILGQQNSENGFKYYPRLALTPFTRPEPGTTSYYRTPIETWTTPPRPPKDKNANNQPRSSDPLGGNTRNRPIVIPDSPQAMRVSASSPIKPSKESKKPYVVPSWARTETATQPRLSEEAQRAADEAAERKREERRASRRKTNAASQGRFRQRGRLANAENIEGPQSEPSEPSQSHESMRPPPLPVMPHSDLPPIIASSDADLMLFPPTNQRAQSPSRTNSSQLPPPVTPKRSSRCPPSTPGTTDFDEDSLFTPLSIARRSAKKGGSPSFSPGIFGSPLARKYPRMISPSAYRASARQISSESSTITVKANETSEDVLRKSKSPALDPDDPQDDSDCPPSSLPIASSDDYEDTSTQDASGLDAQVNDDDLDEDDAPPRKQHWVGLPPSSPPPPTSPCLMPVDEDGELPIEDVDEDLPVPSETDEPEDEDCDDAMMNTTDNDWTPSPTNADEMIQQSTPTPSVSDPEAMDEMAFLEQFTTIGNSDEQGDLQEAQNLNGDDLNSLLSGYGNNMDLNSFLETLKSLPQDESALSNTSDLGSGFDFSNFEGFSEGELLSESVDHVKLAADLQAMLSGCVV